LKIYEKALGPEYPSVATELNNLALLYQLQGNYAESLRTYQQSIKICEKILGPEHPDLATSLNNLASLYYDQGNYAEALPLYQRSLKIREKALGSDHPDVAQTLSNLAALYEGQANFVEALPLYQRASKIRESVLGPEHPDFALSLNNLGWLYYEQGNYVEALPLYQRALKIWEKVLGPEHPLVASILSNLALLHEAQGNYANALPLFQQALRIREKALGPDHPDVAQSLNQLAVLYSREGNYAETLRLSQRSLKIREQALGSEHPKVAESLNTVALVYKEQGDLAKALPLFQRALKIREKAQGPDHPYVATDLNNLASLYQEQGNYDEALPLYQRSLKIRERILGSDHVDVAQSLNNLAGLYQSQGNYADALPLYQRALKIAETAVGPEHHDFASMLNNVASVYEDQGNHVGALPYYQRAAQAIVRNLELTAAVQSERQQLANINISRFFLDSFVSSALLAEKVAGDEGRANDVYTQMLAWKGAVTLRQRLERAARQSDNPEEQKLWNDLQAVATQLATTSRATPNPEQRGAWQQKLADLTQRKEQLEADLSQRSAEFRKLRSQTKLTPDALAKKLLADTVLIDLLQFDRRVDEKQPNGTLKTHWEQRLAAFITRADQPLTMIDLGFIGPINVAVQKWRESYGGNLPNLSSEQQPGEKLRQLIWAPLAEHLDGIKTVLVSPDGEVAKFPWGALPGSKPGAYLIEEIGFAIIPVPQMLPDLLEDNKATSDQFPPTLLLVGDVDYDASPGQLQSKSTDSLFAVDISRPTARGTDGTKFSSLPGTTKEISQVEKLFQDRFTTGQTLELTQSEATAARVRDQAQQHRFIHLATHGFFAPPMIAGAGAHFDVVDKKIVVNGIYIGGAAASDGRLKPGDEILAVASGDDQWTSLEGKTVADATAITRGPIGTKVRLRVKPAAGGEVAEYTLTRQTFAVAGPNDSTGVSGLDPQFASLHPGLLSGIALAGANLPPQPDQDDGIMTARELASLDLQSVDLAVLSACETGLGQSTGGEGMLGLQRAFQVAGARTTVSSLWSVDDAATQTLMTEFYKRLWDKEHPLGKLEALRQAQLEMLRRYDPRAKKLVDRGRGLELDTEPSDNNGHLSPKYWAAFELSGDWR